MGTAILSTCLLSPNDGKDFDDNELSTLSDLLLFIKDECTLEIELYQGAPYDPDNPNIYGKRGLSWGNHYTVNILSKIQQLVNRSNKITFTDTSEEAIPIHLQLPANEYLSYFLKYIRIKENECDQILFVGNRNDNIQRPYEFECKRGCFTIPGSTQAIIELTDVLIPYLKEPENWDCFFPRSQVCKKYNQYILSKTGLNEEEQQALFQTIGHLVAKINGYNKDSYLTAQNTSKNHRRIIYSKNKGKNCYLSIDWESGGFEVFDCKYKHQGQYNFSCELSKMAEPKSHKLKH